ncbi:cytokine inducible SH2-containing protein b [Chanos chanos]|uniref:Cytokine-inducible SH2-containing protein n=1 Tax=Chanos chanos TaxID=29144 RepID=A0A6J2VN66_CHACN|nr:cytokine-inducible SH2-containing protein-like [Chanos chanos]
MILCVQRALLSEPPSVMVARTVSMQSDGNDREESDSHESQVVSTGPCSLPNATQHSKQWDPAKDLCCITTTFQHLHTSGWYWGAISASEARDALLGTSEGTFLVRDSSHPLYMLTLSVKTCQGPTNVRIEYSDGRFRLDSSSPAQQSLLSFPGVPSLVQHYVGSGRREDEVKAEAPIIKDNAILLKLKYPLHRPHTFPSLQHLTRLTINRHTALPACLPLPRRLLNYLQDYPFQV